MANTKFTEFAKENWVPVAGFSISAIIALWFVGRFVMSFIYFNDPRHQDEALKPWMSPRYVVMSYDLPRDVVFDALNISNGNGTPPIMKDIAEQQNTTIDELTLRIEQAAKRYREQNQ